MAILTVPQIAAVWTGNGGDADNLVDACSVCLAESDGNTNAIGPTDDWGLWQINGIHFGQPGVNANTILDPNVNARVAIALSSSGGNWAQWATAYRDIYASGWGTYLRHPEPGSPANRRRDQVVAELEAAGMLPGSALPTTCKPWDIGIPAGLIVGMQPGDSRTVATCPGGPFDAGDLTPGYALLWIQDGRQQVVSSFDRGTIVPGGIVVTIQRGTVPAGGGGAGGPPPVISPSPGGGGSHGPPPIAPLPIGPLPSGAGKEQIQIAWNEQADFLNGVAADMMFRIRHARYGMGDNLK